VIMRLSARIVILLALIMAAVAPAMADTAYVTDHILADLYSTPNPSGPATSRLPTGTPVTVLIRAGEYVRVRTPSGRDGWMLASMLSDTPPAQVALLHLDVRYDRTRRALERLRAKEKRQEHGIDWSFWAVLITGLAAGFALGGLWFDYRQRSRHGGFRI